MRRLLRAVRSRLTLDRIAIAVVLVGVFLGVLSLTQGSSRDRIDHAASLVPKRALLYVHLRVDRGSAQWRDATTVLRKLPALSRLRDQALREVAGGRNLSVVHDCWGRPELADQLRRDANMYKLRRFGNEWRERVTAR